MRSSQNTGTLIFYLFTYLLKEPENVVGVSKYIPTLSLHSDIKKVLLFLWHCYVHLHEINNIY
jgi:hypothetical protein